MNAQRGMPLPDVLHHFWQIFLEMSAPGQKNRYHRDVACALLDQLFDGRLQRRGPSFQERQQDTRGGGGGGAGGSRPPGKIFLPTKKPPPPPKKKRRKILSPPPPNSTHR